MKKFLAAGVMAACLIGGAGAQQVAYYPEDTNQDGYQTTEELVAWYVIQITSLDTNGDGVSKTEIIGNPDRARGPSFEDQVKDGSFAKVDVNHDGKLKGAEITAMAKIITANDMKFCDVDKDGKISNPENRLCTSGETITQ